MNRASVLCVCALALAAAHEAAAAERVIALSARKFSYSLPVITLKRGEPVIVELTAVDRIHGFNAPDLKLRADAIPGVVQRIRLVPEKAGTFVYFCDVFCGDGHEEMSGSIIVEE